MATSLADKQSAPTAEQASTPPSPGDGGQSPQDPSAPAGAGRTCENCGTPMDAGQDWCLNCGAGAPGSLASGAPGWRSGATVLAATAVLALGAAAAAYAALSEGKAHPRVHTTTVAQAATPAAPGALTPGATPTPPATLGTPTTIKPAVPTFKPPKIPLKAVTPKPLPKIIPPAVGGTPTGTGTGTTPTTGSEAPAGEANAEAILLDTNAATTYNPSSYPATDFGDPSLTIDGDTSTGWTAQVEPSVAPKMAEGVAIDLRSPRKLAALGLTTSTPGMTIQVYGAKGATMPAAITDPAWVKLSANVVEHSKHVRLKLKQPTKSFRWIVFWISRAPAASVGTPQAPGHVSVNELELFPGR